MLIPVMLKNGTEDIVSTHILERMLEAGQIMFFRRSKGWVVVGRDEVRGMGGILYRGAERRADLKGSSH